MDTIQTDRGVVLAAVIGLVSIVLVSAVYALSGLVGGDVANWAILLADFLGAATCAALSAILWMGSDEGGGLRRVWAYLAIGMALWTLAETVYAIYELALHLEIPSPSMADFFWVPGYIPLIAAFWRRYRILRVPLSTGQWVALGIIFVALSGLSIVYVIVPVVSQAGPIHTAVGSLDGVINLSLSILYPVGDLLMALGAGLMIIALMGGRFSAVWGLIALGCFAIGVADSMYYAGLASGMYNADVPINLFGSVTDISYLVGYVLIALGLYAQARLQRAI